MATDATKEKKHMDPAGEWHVIDAKDKVLGRVATQAATLILGKHRTDFTQHLVAPVYVVVVNAAEVAVTGSKETQKLYRRHSGHPGNLKERSLQQQREKDPRRIIELAVSGMLPKNGLRKKRLTHLKIYTGASHPHMPQTNTPTK